MNGAESVLSTASAAGLTICFANPGTTELPFVSALDQIPEIRPVLCLAEAVCAGAADGYARLAGKPALTLLHLGPGLANGLAYFHNARRAGTPIVNIIGDHASWHLAADAPLTSDIEALAKSVSTWVRSATSAQGLGSDIAEAIYHAAGGIACLIVPADYQAATVHVEVTSPPPRVPQAASDPDIEKVAKALLMNEPNALFLGGAALSAAGLTAAGRIRAATGCTLLHETFAARVERGGNLPNVTRLPYLPAQARETLSSFAAVVLAGAREPVSFFGYEGQPSSFIPTTTAVRVLAPAPQDSFFDVVGALESLADFLGREDARVAPTSGNLPKVPTGRLTPQRMAATIAAVQPANAVIVDESITSGFDYYSLSLNAPRHTYLAPHVGGAIGHGLPLATGAALAAAERPVIVLEGDGSGMYTLQSLWTHAREQLNVTTVICANRQYRILQLELGCEVPADVGSATDTLLNIDRPTLDWVSIARGFGVPARSVQTAQELAAELKRAIAEPGPHLIEAVL